MRRRRRADDSGDAGGHVDPDEALPLGVALLPTTGPLFFLDLSRLRDEADYSLAPGFAPDRPVSGLAAYEVYRETPDSCR